MSLAPGTLLGPYEVLFPLGAGGMGEVYEARDTRLDRRVALKVLPAHLSDRPEELARFEREARAVAALSHPGILAIHDFGTHQGTAYAAMELLKGETLRERMGGGALPFRKAVDYAVRIAHALAAAHDKGIVHRDLKPENLFVTKDGQMKILDFGLARQTALGEGGVAGSPTLPRSTDPGTIAGTVGYMSPEQVRGLPADPRSDIFSLGVVLYEMLSGRRAFAGGTSAEILTAIIREDPPELSSSHSEIPAPIVRTVLHCLEKHPEERFQSARDLAFDLENTAGTPSATGMKAAPRLDLSTRWRRKALAWLVPLLAGILLGVSLTMWLGSRVEVEPVRIRPLTFSGHDGEPSAAPDGRMIAFTSTRDGTSRVWIKQLMAGGEAPLTEGPDRLPRFSPDGSTVLFVRDEGPVQSAYRTALVGGEPRRIVSDVLEADWSPDGRQIAFVRLRAEPGRWVSILGAVNAQDGHETPLAEFENRILYGVRWSPDGKWIGATKTTGGESRLHEMILVESGSGRLRTVAPRGLVGPLSAPAWSGSGSEVVLALSGSVMGDMSGALGRVIRRHIDSGAETTLFWAPNLFPGGGATEDFARLDILGSGSLILAEVAQRQNLREVTLLDRSLSDEFHVLSRGSSRDRQPAYSPDGEQLIFSSNRSGNLDLWAVSRQTGAVRQITDDPAQDWDPAFTPDGTQILWSSDRSGTLQIWIASADGSGARQVTHDLVGAENPTAARGLEWIVYTSANPDPEGAGIWKIRPDGTQATRLVAGPHGNAEVSPDGRLVLFVHLDRVNLRNQVRVVEIESGATDPFEIDVPYHLRSAIILWGRSRWMPDGRGIAFIAMNEAGLSGVYVQAFAPGRRTAATRRPLAGFSPDFVCESFGISPDGTRLTLSALEQSESLLLAEGVPGVEPQWRRP